jgi:thiamine-phosphate pyrophosphorylase
MAEVLAADPQIAGARRGMEAFSDGLVRLYLVTDRKATRGRDLISVVAECLDAGLRMLQVREKDLPGPDLLALSRSLRDLTRRAGARLYVNGDVTLAREVGADGVQRPHDRRILPADAPGLRIGASVHGIVEAMEVEREGVDFLVFGPVYDTPSKRVYGPPQGLAPLAKIVEAVGVPVYAIGGITPERVREVRAAGAAGVAVISGILSADSPADATRRFLDELA